MRIFLMKEIYKELSLYVELEISGVVSVIQVRSQKVVDTGEGRR